MYANPDRKLYDTLGLVSNLQTTPKGEERRSYLTRSLLSGTLNSIWVRRIYYLTPLALLLKCSPVVSQRGPLKNPSHLGKQGNISQNGGDFVFGPGACQSQRSKVFYDTI